MHTYAMDSNTWLGNNCKFMVCAKSRKLGLANAENTSAGNILSGCGDSICGICLYFQFLPGHVFRASDPKMTFLSILSHVCSASVLLVILPACKMVVRLCRVWKPPEWSEFQYIWLLGPVGKDARQKIIHSDGIQGPCSLKATQLVKKTMN